MKQWLIWGLLALWAGGAAAQRVVIVQGTTSNPNEAERNYARRVAAFVDRSLRPFALGQAVRPDEQVTEATLRDAAVVLLPYNAHLPDAEFQALQAFSRRGGRLVVFYGADSRLAQLMGFKLAPYLVAQREGQWSAMRFNAAAPAGTPPRVAQSSRNMRPALPASPQARVIAQWEDDRSRAGTEPAWVGSPQGFWMSHVLLDDGDDWNKQRLLLALIADGNPALLLTAARGYLDTTASFRGTGNFDAGLQAIAARGGSASTAAIGHARRFRTEAEASLAAGHAVAALDQAHEAVLARLQAYGATLAPRNGERVGVWDHSGAGLYPGDWARTARELRDQGVTDIFVNTLWPALAHYASDVMPRSDTFRIHGDQMAACLAAAKPCGLTVHAWKVCWRVDNAASDLLARWRQEGRLQVTDAGESIPWLCPSHPANLQYEKDALRELLTRYAVDGVHLDYIRYRDSHLCYCTGCRQRFEEFTGRPVAAWPQDVRRAPLQGRFEAWRAGRVTRLVQDLSVFGRRLKPDLQISAAVYGRYPLCMRSVGQDWGQWLEKGWLDFACPMNYTPDLAKFTAWTREQTALPGGANRIWPGIGVTATECQLDAEAVLDQVAILRDVGAGGFVLFDLNQTLARDVLPILRLGATSGKPAPAGSNHP
ncbi:MAG: family 10 glycosylhydrolase [Lentisphaerae bacterium]|nr:family 10 glycosylhydrolase [Lentisphaerota bacterium]